MGDREESRPLPPKQPSKNRLNADGEAKSKKKKRKKKKANGEGKTKGFAFSDYSPFHFQKKAPARMPDLKGMELGVGQGGDDMDDLSASKSAALQPLKKLPPRATASTGSKPKYLDNQQHLSYLPDFDDDKQKSSNNRHSSSDLLGKKARRANNSASYATPLDFDNVSKGKRAEMQQYLNPPRSPRLPSKKFTLADSIAFNKETKAAVKVEPIMRYTPYAHNLGYITSFLFVWFGIVSVGWDLKVRVGISPQDNQDLLVLFVDPVFVGIYAIVVGVIMFVFEYFFGLVKTGWWDTNLGAYRGVFYIFAAIPTVLDYATIMPGIVSLVTGIVQFFASFNKERGKMKGGSYYMNYFGWEHEKGTFYVAMLFIFVNAVTFLYNYMKVELARIPCDRLFKGQDRELNCPSISASWAKGFGNILNLDCALLLVPVSRAVLTKIAEKVNKNNSFPIRKSIEFHQVIGSIVAFSTLGHVAFHYINFAFAARITITAFGPRAWYTGGALMIVMAILYAGAHFVVKKANYETFWFSHHFYTLFFLLLIAHGPHFWEWFVIPLVMFFSDKIIRHRGRIKRVVFVRSVEYNPPVLNINFAPDNIKNMYFREGQYLYILCPVISNFEWHPFSMSSSYGDLEKYGYVSLHIRVQDNPESWTFKLKEYFRFISGAGNTVGDLPFFRDDFHHYDSSGRRQKGLFNGPDGRPLIRIDGTFNSPTQMYYSYKDVMLVGSGIGLTPSAAILRAIMKHKWSKGFNPSSIRFCWILRQSEIQAFAWFIELLVDLMAKVKSDRLTGGISAKHFAQINIYVTNVQENFVVKTTNVGQSESDKKAKLKDIGYKDSGMQLRVNGRKSFIARDRMEGDKNVEERLQFYKKMRETMKLPSQDSVNKIQGRRLLDDELEVQQAGFDKQYVLGFDSQNLFDAILNPKVESKEQKFMPPSKRDTPNRLEDIWIWKGRPDWDTIFSQARDRARKINMALRSGGGGLDDDDELKEAIKSETPTKEIGVCFCGSSAIGSDLQAAVKKYSARDVSFRLNQEYF